MKEKEASAQGKAIRNLIAHITNTKYIGHKVKTGELRQRLKEPEWKCPECFRMQKIRLRNFKMEFLTPKEGTPRYVVLQLHGGGYVGGLQNAHRMFAGLYSEVGKGCGVLTIDYRLAPKHPYPAALEDAVTAYRWLLHRGFDAERIIVAGDSAGGGLAMSLCMYLRDHGMAMPAGIIAMSPWTDLTAGGQSYEINYEKDPLFGNTKDSLVYNRAYVGKAKATNPYISPLFGNFTGFPPMLIQAGSYEMLLSDAVLVARKAKKQGVKVRLAVYPGMFHVFQMAMLLIPESRHAWKEVGKFIDKISK